MAKRWALPDRVFFAAGACHILAYAMIERCGSAGKLVEWIRPVDGFTGNHIFVSSAGRAFDYHGVSDRTALLAHYWRRAQQRYPGWNATLIVLPPDVLVSTSKSRTYEGLWLREPSLFLQDPMPRAHAYLDRVLGSRVSTGCALRPAPSSSGEPPDRLPVTVRPYRRTPEFTETTVPTGLTTDHATKAGVWAVVHVVDGHLTYTDTTSGRSIELAAGDSAVAAPQRRHWVTPRGAVRFFVEFHA